MYFKLVFDFVMSPWMLRKTVLNCKFKKKMIFEIQSNSRIKLLSFTIVRLQKYCINFVSSNVNKAFLYWILRHLSIRLGRFRKFHLFKGLTSKYKQESLCTFPFILLQCRQPSLFADFFISKFAYTQIMVKTIIFLSKWTFYQQIQHSRFKMTEHIHRE